MEKGRFLLISTLLFALFGCVTENTTEVFSKPEKQEAQQTRLSLDEAQSEVENLLAQIDQTTRTDGVQRKVVDYYCIGKQNITRSDTLPEGDELLTYVFNFENDNGYAIVAGDTRIISPILALTDDGYLNPEEGVENP